ncbi:hypothetical protein PHISCL_02746 [Aspergillus sclerotialis]|uniref:Uncharacterized protein n=1 Tax=Aspergillus sclerotialis TaxID=2070753 RepID=A0A3A2ZZV9_9EURO|nr:hypothetical protein PHISCL_02746 [Aspergillus sclerotialis]
MRKLFEVCAIFAGLTFKLPETYITSTLNYKSRLNTARVVPQSRGIERSFTRNG